MSVLGFVVFFFFWLEIGVQETREGQCFQVHVCVA